MADDYGIWVLNETYNATKAKDDIAKERMRQADLRVAEAKRRLNDLGNELSHQANETQRLLNERITRERRRVLSELESMDEQMRAALEQQDARFRSQLQEMRGDIQQVNRRIDQSEQRIQDLSNALSESINSILSHIENQKHRANAYMSQLQLLLQEISVLHPDKLSPGEYELLAEGLTYAQTDGKNGDYEAAIGVAQTHIPTAAALRCRLELLNDEYSRLVIQVHEGCDALRSRILSLQDPEKNQQTLEQGKETVVFDGRIPFWSNGIFNEIAERFAQLCTTIAAEYEPNMDIEALKQTIEKLGELSASLDICVLFSHAEFWEYVNVQSLVYRIHDYMTRYDTWQITDSGFADDDERRSFTAIYENGAGLTASVVVIPSREILRRNRDGSVTYGETQFRIDVFTESGKEDASLCVMTRNGLLSGLTEDNIDIGSNRNAASTASGIEDFIAASVQAGDKIIASRAGAARERLGL